MKRTIKFRGKRITDGEWIYGDFFRNRGLAFIAEDCVVENPLASWKDYNVTPDTVGQFTGICDASGKEIYEGDILRELGSGKLVEVIYDAPEFCYKDNVYVYRFINHPENFEVIGNIYDNPELLKGGEE